MTEPTLAALASKLDEVASELHEIRIWIVGNGQPGIFGRLRDLENAPLRERNGTAWNWRRLGWDVARNVGTVLIIAALGWMVLGARISLMVGQ